jgi:hypothetical protein
MVILKMKRKSFVFFILGLLLLGCKDHANNKLNDGNPTGKNICGAFNINDSFSEIIIQHFESTETLGATVDSGSVNISPEIVVQTDTMRRIACISANELELVGQPQIKEILFGDSSNYGELRNNRYLIKGKIIGIYKYGFKFEVDSYKNVGNNE